VYLTLIPLPFLDPPTQQLEIGIERENCDPRLRTIVEMPFYSATGHDDADDYFDEIERERLEGRDQQRHGNQRLRPTFYQSLV